MLADALVRLWASVPAARRPVLVVEDVHWADAGTWTALRRLAQKANGSDVPLLQTVRPRGPYQSEIARLVADGEVGVVALTALPDTEVGELVAGCLEVPVDAVPPDLPDLVAVAEGSPLLIEE